MTPKFKHFILKKPISAYFPQTLFSRGGRKGRGEKGREREKEWAERKKLFFVRKG